MVTLLSPLSFGHMEGHVVCKSSATDSALNGLSLGPGERMEKTQAMSYTKRQLQILFFRALRVLLTPV